MQNYPGHHEPDDSLDELRHLLASYEAGGLTDEQDARLQELAVESEAAWNLYLQRMFMYATIRREQCNRVKPTTPPTAGTDFPETENQATSPSANNAIFPLLDLESDLLASDNNDPFGAGPKDRSSDTGPGGLWGRINFSFVPGIIMIIASALVLGAVVVMPVYWSTHTDDFRWSIAARITRTIDCRWDKEYQWLREGTFLEKGQQLHLETGLAELEFASGAKVILQGPVRFAVTDRNKSRLDYGQLAATVTEGAEGFTVRTPGMDVVDLGTEFGVAVDATGQIEVQVFKGTVLAELKDPLTTKMAQTGLEPTESVAKSDRPKKILLKKDEAIQYRQESGQVVPVPVRKVRFVRDLDRNDGITSYLDRIVNSSFEVPDIRKVPEYQSEQGWAPSYPIVGWHTSDRGMATSRAAMYQISPYTSMLNGINVGPGATDGRQVATITLDATSRDKDQARQTKNKNDQQRRSNWIFQSIGTVAPADIGKTLILSADAGPQNARGGSPQGEGMVFACFALGANEMQIGTGIGRPASYIQQGEIEQLHRLKASLPITVELVGQELFIVLAASDNGTSTSVDQYHFDNVQLGTEN